ncbi:response regulator [Parahaliea aestuarii]|uniref:response regulator n=1 Tax=Parahaliea aestuarii TaxID=1852021 RepID=UPI00164F86DB|nr:response regulator [Parahaliea aestuarii]
MTGRVLVIEDSEVNLELVRYLLEAHGYRVHAAGDGRAGIEAARRELPDLILCDIQMPHMDGYAVARQLKQIEELKDIPLIAVTALAMVGDREKILAAGFDDYCAKPIDPEGLLAQLEPFLGAAKQSSSKREGRTAPEPGDDAPLVLVVDNLQMNLELATSLLSGSGYRTATASCVTEALTQLVNNPPDLILSDVNMHQGTGFDLLATVRNDSRWRELPFVFITSSSLSRRFRQEGLDRGADEVLFRPLENHDLLAALESCLRRGRDA